MFNRPRLDLVTHVIIDSLVPRLRVKLANLSNTRRQGRNPTLAEWQKDFRHDWNQRRKPKAARSALHRSERTRSVSLGRITPIPTNGSAD